MYKKPEWSTSGETVTDETRSVYITSTRKTE
jgi:hypothetical protein